MAKTDIDIDLVKQEYFHLQKTVEDFDQRGLTIKAWSVTVSIAALGAAFTQKQPTLLLLGSLSAIMFWIIETIWKRFQLAYYYRLRAIERFFAEGNTEHFSAPRITLDWGIGVRKYNFLWILWWPHLFLPHLVVALCGAILFVLDRRWGFMPR